MLQHVQAVQVADDALKARIEKALVADPSLRDSRISVQSVNKGVVLLTGTAKTLSAHLRAVEVVAGMPGVRQAAMKVRDEELEGAVKKAFDAQGFKDVTVKVKNGVVRLTGTVPTGTRRLEAAVLARSIQGVRAVEDDLRVAAA